MKRLVVPRDRIKKLGKEDNFWRASVQVPAVPAPEIYLSTVVPKYGCGSPRLQALAVTATDTWKSGITVFDTVRCA